MTIQHISFTVPINVGGKHNSLTYWSRTTHANEIDITEKGAWIFLKSKESGDTFRTPISNVAYVRETEEQSKVTK